MYKFLHQMYPINT